MIKVACSGYFSILHAGHIDYFRESKELGDYLIVILNNDKQLLKKYGYIPIQCEERKKIIESIRYVDEVIVSIDEDSTISKTLELIKPDIFCNSGDRNLNTSEQSEVKICNKIGCRVLYLADEKTNSSSNIIRRIRGELDV